MLEIANCFWWQAVVSHKDFLDSLSLHLLHSPHLHAVVIIGTAKYKNVFLSGQKCDQSSQTWPAPYFFSSPSLLSSLARALMSSLQQSWLSTMRPFVETASSTYSHLNFHLKYLRIYFKDSIGSFLPQFCDHSTHPCLENFHLKY